MAARDPAYIRGSPLQYCDGRTAKEKGPDYKEVVMVKLETSTEVQGGNGHQYLPGQHPNSQANLPKGQWKPGQSGNPAGRRSYGAHTSEWVNSMATWSFPQLEEVIEDPRAESAKVAAGAAGQVGPDG